MKTNLLLIAFLTGYTMFAQIPSNPVREYSFSNSSLANTAPTGSSGDLILNTGNASTFVSDRLNNSNSALSINSTEFFGGSITANNVNPVNEIGISFWYKFDQNLAAGTTQNILRLTAGGINNFIIRRTSNDIIEHRLVAGSETSVGTIQDPVLQSNSNFVHLFFNIRLETNQREIDTYINGTFVNTTVNSSISTDLFSSNIFLNLGVISNGVGLEAILDDIRIYDRSLTTSEIQQLASEGLNTCTTFVNIPDANFKAALVGNPAINTDGDSEICTTEAAAFTGQINVNNQNISDLTGIQAFTNITDVRFNGNSVSTLDLTMNTDLVIIQGNNNALNNIQFPALPNLVNLSLRDNNLTALNVSSFTSLSNLDLEDNNISQLDVSNLSQLQNLKVTRNQLQQLDLTNNDALFEFNALDNALTSLSLPTNNTTLRDIVVSQNNLTTLDVSAFSSLEDLNFDNNNISNIDLSNNSALRILTVANNNLTNLDVTGKPNLLILQFDNNQIQNIDVSGSPNINTLTGINNNLNQLNVANGNNPNIFSFAMTNNPNLSCIQVSDVNYAQANWSNSVDAGVTFSTNCNFSSCTTFVNIPDANFKAILVADPNINTDGDTEICTTEAQAYTGPIGVSFSNISDLTGIEAFTNITALECFGNQITTLDISNNTQLTRLYCYNNSLTTLNIGQNTIIDRIECGNNLLTSLDVSQCPSLLLFTCSSNQLTNLNVANGNNGNIGTLLANNNPNLNCIQHDIGFTPPTFDGISGWQKDATATWSDNCSASSCTTFVNIPDVNFKAYLVGNSTINTDGDNEICTTEAQAYTGAIFVVMQGISDLTGIEAFINITELYCDENFLTTIDISSNTALTNLTCGLNQLTSLDVSNNTLLTEIDCGGNQITNLNVTTNLALENLFCGSNQITSLDVSSNINLERLNCAGNQLTSLNVANTNNANMTLMSAHTNPNLTCVQHDNGFNPTTNSNWVKDATANWSDNCASLSVADVTFNNTIIMYPNPASTLLNIASNGYTIESIEIFNMIGKKIIVSKSQSIDVSSLTNGIYITKIKSDDNRFAVKKFIKQ